MKTRLRLHGYPELHKNAIIEIRTFGVTNMYMIAELKLHKVIISPSLLLAGEWSDVRKIHAVEYIPFLEIIRIKLIKHKQRLTDKYSYEDWRRTYQQVSRFRIACTKNPDAYVSSSKT